jgi:glyoxylase-like metal-dependent hydrolase (beta-lactamase superfamily II)
MGLTAAKSAGLYPANYQMPACPIDQELDDGDVVSVGELKLHTLATPGHCDGHLSFLLDGVDRPVLIGGDLVFWNGTILIQNVADCRLDAYARSVARVANLNFEALLPGHGQISLKGGRQHAQKAAAMFERLLIPPNVL